MYHKRYDRYYNRKPAAFEYVSEFWDGIHDPEKNIQTAHNTCVVMVNLVKFVVRGSDEHMFARYQNSVIFDQAIEKFDIKLMDMAFEDSDHGVGCIDNYETRWQRKNRFKNILWEEDQRRSKSAGANGRHKYMDKIEAINKI